MIKNVIIEGLDRLGKSTLVEGIEDRLGFFNKIHFGKPKECTYYKFLVGIKTAKMRYQVDSFIQMFEMLSSPGRFILDRGHLGEAVYAKRYRGYNGDYVFDLESVKNSEALRSTLLVLLVNRDNELEKKLVDDGESFDWTKRAEEQDDFEKAFFRSKFHHKLLLHVGNGDGTFVDKDTLAETVVAAIKNT